MYTWALMLFKEYVRYQATQSGIFFFPRFSTAFLLHITRVAEFILECIIHRDFGK